MFFSEQPTRVAGVLGHLSQHCVAPYFIPGCPGDKKKLGATLVVAVCALCLPLSSELNEDGIYGLNGFPRSVLPVGRKPNFS